MASTTKELVAELEKIPHVMAGAAEHVAGSKALLEIVKRARRGYYHDFSEAGHTLPKIALYEDLLQAARRGGDWGASGTLRQIAENVKQGAYDERPDEP